MLFYSSILNSEIIIEKKRLENQDNWIIIFESSIFQLTFSEHVNNRRESKIKIVSRRRAGGRKKRFLKIKTIHLDEI